MLRLKRGLDWRAVRKSGLTKALEYPTRLMGAACTSMMVKRMEQA